MFDRLIGLDHGRRALRLVERGAEGQVGDGCVEALDLPGGELVGIAAVLGQAVTAVGLQQMRERAILDQRRLHLDVRFPDVLAKVGRRAAVVLDEARRQLGELAILAEFGAEREGDAVGGERRGDAVAAEIAGHVRLHVVEQADGLLPGRVEIAVQIVDQRLIAVAGAECVERYAARATGRAGRRAVDVDDVERVVDPVEARQARQVPDLLIAREDAADVVGPGIANLATHAAGRPDTGVGIGIGHERRIEPVADVDRHGGRRPGGGAADDAGLRVDRNGLLQLTRKRSEP